MEDKYSAFSGVKSKDMETAGFVTEFFSHIDKYVAPKYAYQYGMLNNRCDGDSFGMLIMERISGRILADYDGNTNEARLKYMMLFPVVWNTTNQNLSSIIVKFPGQSGRLVENDGGLPWSDQILKLTPEVKPSSRALTRALMVALCCCVSRF